MIANRRASAGQPSSLREQRSGEVEQGLGVELPAIGLDPVGADGFRQGIELRGLLGREGHLGQARRIDCGLILRRGLALVVVDIEGQRLVDGAQQGLAVRRVQGVQRIGIDHHRAVGGAEVQIGGRPLADGVGLGGQMGMGRKGCGIADP